MQFYAVFAELLFPEGERTVTASHSSTPFARAEEFPLLKIEINGSGGRIRSIARTFFVE
jgi:hypothetical protein